MGARVLVLGGTAQARLLANQLNELGVPVVSSLAGRVREPKLPAGEVRTGGFGGPCGMAEYLRGERITALVDATHPFATRISENAVTATTDSGVEMLVLRRAPWTPGPGDDWHRVGSLPEAAETARRLGSRVLLTTGRQGLHHFTRVRDRWFLARTVDAPDPPLPSNMTTISARGPFTTEAERELLLERRIDVLVSKNSGGPMTEGKLAAARELGIPVVLVEQPQPPHAPTVDSVPDAIAWLRERVDRLHAG
ncbi:precorrin-6A/cobalt-precorrin-6A reductase [Actinopolyspora biskrensis]|uniref:Precorrin-6A/cobalt-precorrin-6A reductase n=1 Tax=Actinopolyspora biskrensis TaxID=1470178 RepID=A0A852Z6Y9_9ACTN|nr:cobalt-precorrin-6A reductase [Actinopolyspora biskrensis]NYH77963.1 precorrin-6A/cobalt-precorrin-6A reductase [Actinopolyspora biskrensis]